jgi:predicted RNase H-like HicB family nuclease
MKKITKVDVCLEAGPESTSAFAPEYPGCWVFGRTIQSALQKVEVAVTGWADWLLKYGEIVPDISKNVKAEVTEILRVDYNPIESGKPEPLFWSEVAPVTREDINRTISLMEHSRSELMVTIHDKTEDYMDWQPPNQPRTIKNCIMHIANVELWYITRLNIKIPDKSPENPLELLNFSRDVVLNNLNNFPKNKMKGIFQPRRYKNPVCNLWTARKVLRRLIDHERLHTKYIIKVIELYERATKVRY